jgi:hypothetical protein
VKRSLAALAIFIAVCATYAPVVRNGFVWDDTALVLRDPLIRSWRLIPEGFNHFLFVDATASDFYRPLQRLTYTLEYAAFAFAPAPYHISNVLLHAGAAIALLFFANELLLAFGLNSTRRKWIAAVTALVWALHPIHTAAVVYVSGRADPLAALFGFLGCYLLLRSGVVARSRFILLIAAFAAFLLSALSKESGLMFPAISLVLALLLNDRKAFVRIVVVAAFVAVIYLGLRQAAERFPTPTPSHPAPLVTRPITMARAVAEYAGLIIFPVNLHMDRELNARPTESSQHNMNVFAGREMQTLLGAILAAAMIYWGVHAYKQNSPVWKILLLATLTYLPVSGIIELNAPVAEHWIYVPTTFLFLAGALTVTGLIENERLHSMVWRSLTVALVCWTGFLSVRTCLRTMDWKSQRTFLEKTIAAGGDSPRMLINLAGLELSEGHLDLAKSILQKALLLEPDQPLAVINLAVVAMRQNDFKTARELASRATQMPWVDAQADELIAVLDDKENGKVNPLRLRLAARTGAPNWNIEKRYIRFMAESGATDAAVRELQMCLQTQWYRAESWQLLEQLLSSLGMANEARIARAQAAAYDVHLNRQATLL